MPSEATWSDPIKVSSVAEKAADLPGLYRLHSKTPDILFYVGAAEESLKKSLLAVGAQDDGATDAARHLAADLEVGAVFGFDVKLPEHRKGFLARDCYFLIRPMPDASADEIKKAAAALNAELSPRYAGEIGRYKTIEW